VKLEFGENINVYLHKGILKVKHITPLSFLKLINMTDIIFQEERIINRESVLNL